MALLLAAAFAGSVSAASFKAVPSQMRAQKKPKRPFSSPTGLFIQVG